MDLSHWLLFTAVCLATTYSPGPGVLLAVSNALTHGPRQALISSSGNALGIFIVAGLTVSGLGLLLHTSALAFTALKVVGAGYLIYLGIRQWRARGNAFSAGASAAAESVTPRRLFLNGLTVALSNPKSVLFFSAVFPQFMPEQAGVGQLLLMTSTFAACAVISHLSYVLAAGPLMRWCAAPRRLRNLNRSLGLVFMGMGLGVLRMGAGGRP